MKLLTQFAALVGIFLASWFGLREINWVRILDIEKTHVDIEQRLGDTMWEMIRNTEYEIRRDTVINGSVKKIVNRLCLSNDIDTAEVKLHVVESDVVNAFALPGNHMVVYTGLIKACENESELMGVIGHELAHQQKKHVMKKLLKEVGFGALAGMAGGNNGRAAQRMAEMLSSTAYDRKLESEADRTSADYMLHAGAEPQQFAGFLYRLSLKEGDLPEFANWVSTHPDSKERAESINDYAKGRKRNLKPVLSQKEWKLLEQKIGMDEQTD